MYNIRVIFVVSILQKVAGVAIAFEFFFKFFASALKLFIIRDNVVTCSSFD